VYLLSSAVLLTAYAAPTWGQALPPVTSAAENATPTHPPATQAMFNFDNASVIPC